VLARTLEVLHRKGIVHRDLKPSNVLVRPSGEPVLMDFGLARSFTAPSQRLTGSGTRVGTPAYMSPEQVAGKTKAIGPATDIYSLSVMLYELVTGELPFIGEMMVVFAQILHGELEPPSRMRAGVDTRIDALCRQAMAKRPEERFASMAAFAEALDEYVRATVPVARVAADEDRTAPTLASPPVVLPDQVACGKCGQPLLFRPEMAGRRVRCPRCQAVFDLPPAAPAAKPVAEVLEVPPAVRETESSISEQTRGEGRPKPRKRRLLPVVVGLLGVMLLLLVGIWLIPGDDRTPDGTDSQARKRPSVAVSGNDHLPSGKERRPSDRAPPAPGKKETPTPAVTGRKLTNSIGMEFVLIPAGKFLMGSPETEKDRETDEGPQHEVEITYTFYLGVHEVMQEQYEKVMGTNPSYFSAKGSGSSKGWTRDVSRSRK
jgi:uncharacterized Zn finger protein (UPF0148 family)